MEGLCGCQMRHLGPGRASLSSLKDWGGIRPPDATGSISIWTYETARYLAKDCALLVIEFGTENFRTQSLEHEGATYVYVPKAINRVANALHRRATNLTRFVRSAERRLRRPQYASRSTTWHTFFKRLGRRASGAATSSIFTITRSSSQSSVRSIRKPGSSSICTANGCPSTTV